ncbi:single-stranded DNA-binding protein [candidate division WOR-1 bacterium RIFOXYB2_FULL_42_35]|uniref:Single-stranded DNA-binding protein n=1 Tax=candidate division WOR-1 bacterium RIFOXYC2_FULL_41_25 TaxID=1802586 RepID=A0A1F4TIR5_UNCSA|nr:MAG: single-stranded DNA-binding protein [candidate division WOR-1 bacterium RIFOXYA2_FULL_41_14]OGC21628.1 MAG: single-stranded DNA-binding protein [candidate division WOR-1 bacterium RIFOXYB2_FULL_42_35]OGC32631.1 MAG: single-stranded DNA-binding protein [candidate division WOR-1 bacterium RIFOXYC2_FULL_41_25]OGC41689.1 MAG: single-stranded DNA-binding protein [candidate division WOR-1 bacterium RIFOXYD2_FULL_41_8]
MKIDEEVQRLLEVLPPRVKLDLSKHAEINVLIEVILDLGRAAEARYADNVYYLPGEIVNQKDIEFVVEKLGSFSSDNRAGIECTLHRISCLRNRTGKIVGLTCRVGRVIYGTNDIIRDVIESGKNILFLGPPGIGKTTKLREAARVLSDEFKKRVVIVDTSNEIAGDGDIPHPGIGKARRMQVQTPEFQHRVMIEAVENHMPEVVIVDEIGTEAEAAACRTIAERGVQLIGTAHGVYLENVISNPTLSDLAGGIQSVILGDEEAKRRHTQKAILERKAPPTFDVCIEIRERDKFAIYTDVAKAVDSILRERVPHPEIRVRKEGGKIEVHKAPEEMPDIDDIEVSAAKKEVDKEIVRIFPFGVNRGILERALLAMQVPATVSRKFDEADIVLTTKAKARAGTKIEKAAREHGLPLHVIKNNVAGQVNRFLKYYFKVEGREESDAIAIREAEEAIEHVKTSRKVLDLNPQNAYLRRLQHQLVQEAGLNSVSVGDEPKRRLRIYPV